MLNSVGMPFCVPPSEMELRGWTGAVPEALPSAAGPIPGQEQKAQGHHLWPSMVHEEGELMFPGCEPCG